MPRSKEFQKDVVLSRAMEVFWEKGYGSTSVQDLVERMGINRFSIYATFGDKEGLFLSALDHYGKTVVERLLLPLENGDGGLDAIRGYFDRLVDAYCGPKGWRGCLMINSVVELDSQEHRAAKDKIQEYSERLRSAFERSLERAKARGEVRSSSSVGELSGFLLNQAFGLGVHAKLPSDQEALRSRVATALSVLEPRGNGAS
jgi:TetR/AcrR family transcriptional repressor of nem operon